MLCRIDRSFAVYYRLYANDNVIPSINAFKDSDPYLGRIDAILVAPPQTALSLKRYVAKSESVDDPTWISLFLTLTSQEMVDDSQKIDILANSGPGFSEVDPVVLVAIIPNVGEVKFRSAQAALLARTPVNGETRYSQ